MSGIGVGEEQEVSPCVTVALEAGPWLSVPAIGQLLPPDQPETGVGWKALDDGRGAVAGAVVYDQQLEWAVARIQDGAHDGGNRGCLVPRRNNDRHEPSGSGWCIGEAGSTPGESRECEEGKEPGNCRKPFDCLVEAHQRAPLLL